MTNGTSPSEKAVYIVVLLAAILLYIFSDSSFVERFSKISTALLAILTAGYVLLTYWILKSTRQSIQEQTRPFVIASLPLEGFEIVLSIKNIGNRPAENVNVHFDPPLDRIGEDFPLKEAAEGLPSQSFMPPEFEVRQPVALTPAVLKLDSSEKVFKVSLHYCDSQGVTYSDKYDINLGSYVQAKGIVQHDLKHYLKSISDNIKDISEYAKKNKQPPAATANHNR